MKDRIYQFSCVRSQKDEHQVPGVSKCSAIARGSVPAANLAEAHKVIFALCCVPGVWSVRVSHGSREFKEVTVKVNIQEQVQQ